MRPLTEHDTPQPIIRSTLHVKQAPRRTCVGCRTTRAKPELVRIAATPDGVHVDPDHTLPGRGAYVCPDHRCLEAIERAGGHTLRRALRTAHIADITVALSELHRRLEDAHGTTRRPNTTSTAPVGPATSRTTTTKE